MIYAWERRDDICGSNVKCVLLWGERVECGGKGSVREPEPFGSSYSCAEGAVMVLED